jgi:TolB-like protein/Tfp pilus assembly protein PilF
MGSLFYELKRRNIFRVAVAYLVIGWLLVQVFDSLQGALDLAAWTVPFVVALLVTFLPILLLWAWSFEITPQGLVKTEAVEPEHSITPETGRKIDRITLVALIFALGYYAGERQLSELKEGTEPIVLVEKSIAVLPFADLSFEGDQGHFADGVAEEILTFLTKASDLKVTGRRSSFRFKGQELDIKEIARALGVAHILEGSVRKVGNRVRVSVQLINAADGFHVWSETYDAELTDIFRIQDQIGQSVVAALEVRIGEYAGDPEVVGTKSMDAYSLYLRGRQLLAARGEDNLWNAGHLFEAAIVLDPEFGRAHSALGRVLALAPYYAGSADLDRENLSSRALEAAATAISIDPTNAEAYSVIGEVKGEYYREFEAAEAAHLRAVELAPNDAEIANFAGDFYRLTMNSEAALQWEGRAAELNPLLMVNLEELARVHYLRGEFEAALPLARQAIALSPGTTNERVILILSLIDSNRFAEARSEIDAFAVSAAATPGDLASVEVRLALAENRMDDALDAFRALEAAASENPWASHRAMYYAVRLGQLERAGYWAETAYLSNDPDLPYPYHSLRLPEDWPQHEALRAALDKPDLKRLFEVRRRNLKPRP